MSGAALFSFVSRASEGSAGFAGAGSAGSSLVGSVADADDSDARAGSDAATGLVPPESFATPRGAGARVPILLSRSASRGSRHTGAAATGGATHSFHRSKAGARGSGGSAFGRVRAGVTATAFQSAGGF
jgi:hypothetical protein